MADTAAESVPGQGEQQPSAATDEVNSERQLVQAKPDKVPMMVGPRGVQLTTLEEVWRFANYLAVSGMAPTGMTKVESLVVAMQMGAEVGLPPMAAIQNIAVINGRPSLWGDAMLAVCRASGMFDEQAFEELIPDGPTDKLTATCTVRRLPNGKPCTRTFSRADAKQASLSGKTGPWQQYPKRMLQLRARSWALRDAFADVLRGMACREEMREIITVESKPAPSSLDGLAEKIQQDAADKPAPPAEAAPPPATNGATEPVEPVPPPASDQVEQAASTPAPASETEQYLAQIDTAQQIQEVHAVRQEAEKDARPSTDERRIIRERAETRIETLRARRKGGKAEGQSEMFKQE